MTAEPTTTTGTPVPRTAPSLRLQVAAGAGDLGQAVRGAVKLLVEAGVLSLARPGERADLLHTVGAVDPVYEVAARRRLHTVDRIELRGGRELAPTRRWLHREHRRAAQPTIWLVHGRTAGRLVVGTGLAPGGRVHCLPVLAPMPTPSPAWAGRRAGVTRLSVRRQLGIAPGVRLVLGAGCPQPAGLGGWRRALERLGRTDVRLLELPAVTSRGSASAALPLDALLDAADCLVAAGEELTAVSPAVPALAAGVPVVAVSTDSAAELVTPGRDGVVVAPRVTAVVDAVVQHLDTATWRPQRPAVVQPPAAERLARRLLHVYGCALAEPGSERRVLA